MTHGARKAKGRRLQVTVAEAIARRCDLTISAVPPTKPGKRNGVLWVPEHQAPDLLVRMMGQAGADVAILSEKAKARVAFDMDNSPTPLWIECKNTEAWDFGASFWRTATSRFIENAMAQVEGVNFSQSFRPIVVLGKNNWPPLVVWVNNPNILPTFPSGLDVLLFFDEFYAVTTLDSFLTLLVGRGE